METLNPLELQQSRQMSPVGYIYRLLTATKDGVLLDALLSSSAAF
jgi:hypothetical protein